MSSNEKNRYWVLVSRPGEMVSIDDFEMKTADREEPKAGEFGVETLSVMVAPPGIVRARAAAIGSVIHGVGVGRVVNSKNAAFPDGTLVSGALGWAEYNVSDGGSRTPVSKVALPAGMPHSTQLHVLGLTGATAYFSLLEVARVKLGDVVLVSAAAGNVGSIVCQLAKMSGCHVVGIAGSDEKCAWLSRELGVDATINYRREDIAARVKELCLQGIDLYFDNVGGKTLEVALNHLNRFGRILLCGATSQYDQNAPYAAPSNYFNLVPAQASILGFHISTYLHRLGDSVKHLAPLIAAGRLKYVEDVAHGIENAPEALLRVMRGENFGTQLIRIASENSNESGA